MKIENGYWYVSYDNGTTWAELGKAVGEDGKDGVDGENGKDGQDGKPGADGKDGQDGDSMFTSVTYDEHNVYFTLTDGSVLIVPRGNSGDAGENDPSDIIKFEDLNVKLALLQMDIDTNGDGEISYGEAAAYTGSISMRNNKDILSFKEFQYFTGINKISESTFDNCINLFEIILPEGIQIIENNAFYNCSKIGALNFPSNLLSIGNNAFYNCSNLKTIVIPLSCKIIGESAFENCSKITEVSILGCEYISDFAFKNCNLLMSLKINEGCIYIGNEAFLNHSLINVDNLPKTIEYLGAESFSSNSLVSFTFPDNLKDGYLPYYTVDDVNYMTVKWNSVDYKGSLETLKTNIPQVSTPRGLAGYYISGTTSSGRYQYSVKFTLSDVIIGSNVKTIPSNFCCRANITSIILPENITLIGNNAFEYSSLKTIYSKNAIPPTLEGKVFPTTVQYIYVSIGSVVDYKSAWSDYADKIVGYNF